MNEPKCPDRCDGCIWSEPPDIRDMFVGGDYRWTCCNPKFDHDDLNDDLFSKCDTLDLRQRNIES